MSKSNAEYEREAREEALAEERAAARDYLGPREQLEADRRAGDRYERWFFGE